MTRMQRTISSQTDFSQDGTVMSSTSVASLRNLSGTSARTGQDSSAVPAADLDSSALEVSSPHRSRSKLQLQPHVGMVSGAKAILALSDLLLRFADRCDQAGAMEDMTYFLSKPGFLKRVPRLMLIAKSSDLTPESLLGALLLFEYNILNRRTGLYATNDRSGRNTLVAPAHLRSQIAHFATQTLLDRGAHVAMITYRQEEDEIPVLTTDLSSKVACRWATRTREIAEYLPLEKTYDKTLALIGQRTRSNMRYYRRRAEKELGCNFVPFVEMRKEEFLALNRECMFAVPDHVAAWRYDSLQGLSRPLLMGMRDRDGRWLSLVGGRRFKAGSELLWQMNRDGMPLYSLSLVMRSYFMEHEIAAGSERFYIEGGTSHPIRHSFTTETLTDLTVMRSSPIAFAARKLVQRLIPVDNELAKMFSDTDLVWHRLGRGKTARPSLP